MHDGLHRGAGYKNNCVLVSAIHFMFSSSSTFQSRFLRSNCRPHNPNMHTPVIGMLSYRWMVTPLYMIISWLSLFSVLCSLCSCTCMQAYARSMNFMTLGSPDPPEIV